MDENGGPTPRRRSAAHAPSTRRPSHLPLPRASTRHTIPHASPPTNRTSHSTALPPAFSTSHSNTHSAHCSTNYLPSGGDTRPRPERFKRTRKDVLVRTESPASSGHSLSMRLNMNPHVPALAPPVHRKHAEHQEQKHLLLLGAASDNHGLGSGHSTRSEPQMGRANEQQRATPWRSALCRSQA